VSETSRIEERPDAGFTLVELLAAIGLLSFVSVILLGSLHLALKAWERGAAYADRVDRVALVQSFLRRAIEDAYPFFAVREVTSGHVDFEGTAETLRLLAPAARALRAGGRSRLSLGVAPGRQGLDLIATAAPELAGDPASTGGMKVLLPNVQSVELSYFGHGRSGKDPTWRNQWTAETRLPELVRIAVSFPPGDTRIWPELIVAPRIGADVGCVYDPLTKQCRGR
jgi:general secretion pathway protein J